MLEAILKQKKSVIIEKWVKVLTDSYPPETSKFIKTQKDPFLNPVGNTITQVLEDLFNELLIGLDREKIISVLDPIIRIRVVQNFSPSQAVSFILSLKKIIREILKKSPKNQLEDKVLLFENRIDNLCLIAFDIYAECKQNLYDIKVNEKINRSFSAFERAGLLNISNVKPGLDKPSKLMSQGSDSS